MAPKAHTVNHAPLDVFVVFIARILEYVSVIISKGMSADASFGATMSARRRSQRRRWQNRTIRIESEGMRV
jgi:hypothetical protein